MKPEPSDSQIIKEGHDPVKRGEEKITISPVILERAIRALGYVGYWFIYFWLLAPWCGGSGPKMATGAAILAWISNQLNQLKKK